ncbi:hypothetical protein BTR23_10485 [Alkalihalophilus pseudofirmus]|nr:hypothetical protein BTR23_10485 [Alkalihalophilus pseudofirmus]
MEILEKVEEVYDNHIERARYRTTVEIMNKANEVIKNSKSPGIVLAKPVVRHDEEPEQKYYEQEKDLASMLEDKIQSLREEKFKSIAIIGKTKEECQKIKKQLAKHTNVNMKLLDDNEQMNPEEVAIVPSYLSKGLEFDAVFILSSTIYLTYVKNCTSY